MGCDHSAARDLGSGQARQFRQRIPRALAIAAVALAVACAHAKQATAQTNWTGNTSTDWTDPGNWTGGVPGPADNVSIDSTTPNPAVLGVSGSASATSGYIFIGSSASGALTIQNGSTLTSNSYVRLGEFGAASHGEVTVTGANTAWIINNTIALVVGNFGTGKMIISDGASVATPTGYSVVNNGTLSIESGGTLTTGTFGYVGSSGGALANAIATVTGAGSQWTIAQDLTITKGAGSGTLTIASGGIVTVAGGAGKAFIASASNSTGTLNLGSAAGVQAVAPGTLAASTVTFGAGTGSINFNHTATDYAFDPIISGLGAVNVLAGTTIFNGDHLYTGRPRFRAARCW